jgi:hypothetical protein
MISWICETGDAASGRIGCGIEPSCGVKVDLKFSGLGISVLMGNMWRGCHPLGFDESRISTFFGTWCGFFGCICGGFRAADMAVWWALARFAAVFPEGDSAIQSGTI